jgi:hypothetical protein
MPRVYSESEPEDKFWDVAGKDKRRDRAGGIPVKTRIYTSRYKVS